MSAETADARWPQIRALLEDALDLPAAERAAYVHSRAGDDPLVLKQVLDLLQLHADEPAALADGARALVDVTAALQPMPERIGAYRLLRSLGEGGMGSVYLGERADGGFTQQVAIKLIRYGFAQPGMVERFRQEREILARLNHPNIARLSDGGVAADGRPWYAMEHVQGVPITQWCEQHQLDAAARVRLLRQALDAVAYAHRNLIVHRDIKPSNLMVDAQGVVKLLDFGIAKLLDGDRLAATQTADGLMTPHYAAPEQISGEAITTATDVHALGILLFELLSGERPYGKTSRSSFEVQREVLEQAPPSLDAAWQAHQQRVTRGGGGALPRAPRALRSELQSIVDRCLEKQPARRYESVAALAADLDAWLQGAPVSVRSGRAYRIGKWLRRHALAVGAAVAVAGLLVSALVVSLTQAERARAAAAQASEQARIAQAIQQFLVDGYANANPYNTDGRVVTARDLLEAGAARIDTALADQPGVRAELHATFGRVFADLEQRRLAEREYGLARDYFESAAGHDVERALRMRAGIAEQRFYGDDVPAALIEFRALIEATRDLPQMADVYANMHTGVMLSLINLGRFAEAVSFSEQAVLPLLERTVAPSSYDYSFGLYNQALAELYRLNLPQALKLVERFVALDRAHVKPGHPGMISDVQFMAVLLIEFDRAEDALALATGVLKMRERNYRSDDAIVASSRGRLAVTLAAVGRLDEALAAYATAIADFTRQRGTETDDTARIRRDYALALLASGREADAAAQFERARATWRALDGRTHPDALRVEAQLAAIGARRGDLSSLSQLREIEALQRQLNQAGLAETLTLLSPLLATDAAAAARAEALALYRAQGRVLRARLLDPAYRPDPALAAGIETLAQTAHAVLDAAKRAHP